MLSERRRWLYYNKAMAWMPLNRIFRGIYLKGISKHPYMEGKNHVTTFTRSHIQGESYWCWEVPSLR